MSVEVRSLKDRPSASTAVTTRGTARTMRVLRRFFSSEAGWAELGDTASPELLACLLPLSSIRFHALSLLTSAKQNHLRLWRFVASRVTLLHRSSVEHPYLFGNPDWPNE